MQKDSRSITSADVEKIYRGIEKERKGSFYIQVKDKHKEIPNHIPEKVATFYNNEITQGRNTSKLEFDATMATNITQGLF